MYSLHNACSRSHARTLLSLQAAQRCPIRRGAGVTGRMCIHHTTSFPSGPWGLGTRLHTTTCFTSSGRSDVPVKKILQDGATFSQNLRRKRELKRSLFKSSMFQLGPYVFVFYFLFPNLNFVGQSLATARLQFCAITPFSCCIYVGFPLFCCYN